MNEQKDHFIVMGSGRLASQIIHKLKDRGLSVIHAAPHAISDKNIDESNKSVFEQLKYILENAGIADARAVFLVDTEDENNIQNTLVAASLNKKIPIIVSLFNDGLIPHLQSAHKNLLILNPARIAAPHFVDAIYTEIKRKNAATEIFNPPKNYLAKKPRLDIWITLLVAWFVALIFGSAIFFHLSEKLSWVDSFYFTVTMITTTGFGDINLLRSSVSAKLYITIIMLIALVSASITFSMIVDHLIKGRSEKALGRKKYKFKNHVILCGLGRVGYSIAQEILKRGEKLLIIENNPNNKYLDSIYAEGVPVLIGDGILQRNLDNAGVANARCVIAAMNSDLKNLEVGLNARSLQNNIRLILRIFDKDTANEIRDLLDIHIALSKSAIASDEFVRLV